MLRILDDGCQSRFTRAACRSCCSVAVARVDPLAMASDFAGMDMLAFAVKELGYPSWHLFASEIDAEAQAFLRPQS